MPTLEAIHWGPASKAKPKQLVVLCHGLGADAYDLIDLAPAIAIAGGMLANERGMLLRARDHEGFGRVKKDKRSEERQHAKSRGPAQQRDPVASVPEYIDPRECLCEKLLHRRHHQISVPIFPPVRGPLQYIFDKGHVFYMR